MTQILITEHESASYYNSTEYVTDMIKAAKTSEINIVVIVPGLQITFVFFSSISTKGSKIGERLKCIDCHCVPS